MDADRALFNGQIQGIVAACFENERPPCGLAGMLDWHLHGAISRIIRSGAITGKVGECVYLPVNRNGVTHHIILAGAGKAQAPGQRDKVPDETWDILQKNLVSLKLPKVGISKADFGDVTGDFLNKTLKGANLWIAR